MIVVGGGDGYFLIDECDLGNYFVDVVGCELDG